MTSNRPPLFLGRQPIFDSKLQVEAYELLYRTGRTGGARIDDEDQATSDVLINACIELGLERVVGEHQAYVNLTESFLRGKVSLPVGPEQVVLEVLEDTEPTQSTREGIERLKSEGYRIALDDFEPNCISAPLLPLADVVKVDCRELGIENLGQVAEQLSRYDVRLLAEKIESYDELQHCKEAGFELFQGYFLARPTVLEGRKLQSNRTQLLRILALLYSEDADIDAIQDAVAYDVSLSYRLMRYINSAAFGLSRELQSVREAVMYLGLTRVRNLVTLFLLASVDNKPQELMRIAMLRGRMCETLARDAGRDAPDGYFTVGLFSCLDAMLDVAMRELLEQLPLSESVNLALLDRAGDYGEVLDCVLAYEVGRFDAQAPAGVEDEKLGDAFIDACTWVERLTEDTRTV